MIKRFVLILKKNSIARMLLIGLGLCLIVAIFIFAIYQNFGLLLAKSTPLPVNLHSSKQANYSQDPVYMQIQPMELQLVIDAIWDQNPNAQELSVRLTAVNENFIEKVSSITPQPPTDTISTTTDTSNPADPATTSTLAITASPTLTTPEPTKTSGPPTNTNIPGAPTNTQSPPTHTPEPTNTSPPPTHTVEPTNTSLPPTYTLEPTNTAAPSNTPVPPSFTPNPCGSISISGFYTETKRARWSINNSSVATISISQINLSWPAGNDSLDKIFLGSAKIWDQNAPPPSVVITSGWTGGSRTIGSNASKELKFTFISQSISSGYNLTVEFTNECSVNYPN